jgi:hypothetical protein
VLNALWRTNDVRAAYPNKSFLDVSQGSKWPVIAHLGPSITGVRFSGTVASSAAELAFKLLRSTIILSDHCLRQGFTAHEQEAPLNDAGV